MRRLLFLLSFAVLTACGSSPRPSPPPILPPRSAPAPEQRPMIILEPTFAANAGRLPWPAEGTVIGFFGRRRDATTGTLTEAVGIDISTAPEAPVRSVFSGRVARVGQMAAFGTYVMLKHDGWTTVYGNLSRVDVASGDVVAVDALLGASGARDARRGAGLFFAVFQNEDPVDPLPWLRPRASGDR